MPVWVLLSLPFEQPRPPPPICFLHINTEGSFIIGDGIGFAPHFQRWAEPPSQGTTFWQHSWGFRNAFLEVVKEKEEK